MSTETLLSLSHVLDMSLDYIISGKTTTDNNIIHTDEVMAIMGLLDHCPSKQRKYALDLMKLFLDANSN